MTTSLRLSLPLSADFGNANSTTQGQSPLTVSTHWRHSTAARPSGEKCSTTLIIVAHSYELKAIATKIQESGGDATRFWHARKLTLR
jgi:hypothetical protein